MARRPPRANPTTVTATSIAARVTPIRTPVNEPGPLLYAMASIPCSRRRPSGSSRNALQALGVPVAVHPEARAILEQYYATRGGLNEARLRMARVPQGAELIPNRYTGAPGSRHGNLFIMAGVPHITAGMLDALTGTLEGGRPLVSVTIGAFAPESEVAVTSQPCSRNSRVTAWPR